jgi:hypothetical protein
MYRTVLDAKGRNISMRKGNAKGWRRYVLRLNSERQVLW